MKAFRKTSLLIGIFLLLLLLVVLFGTDGAQKRSRDKEETSAVFTPKQLEMIDEITFRRGEDEPVVLLKSDHQWRINGVLVDSSEEQKLRNDMASFANGKLVSKSSLNWDKYGLSDESASVITFKQAGKEISKQYFGESGPSYQSVYVRHDGKPSVYAVNTSLDDFARYEPVRWINKHLFLFEKDQVASFVIRLGDRRFSLRKTNGEWEQLKDESWQKVEASDQVDALLENLGDLKADDVVLDEALFSEADNAIALMLDSGKEYVVSVDRIDESHSYAKISDQPGLLKLSNDLSSRLKMDFLEPAPVSMSEGTESVNTVE